MIAEIPPRLPMESLRAWERRTGISARTLARRGKTAAKLCHCDAAQKTTSCDDNGQSAA